MVLIKTTKPIGAIETIQWRVLIAKVDSSVTLSTPCVLVFSLNATHIESLARIWTGNGIDLVPLTEDRRFTTILSQCVGTKANVPKPPSSSIPWPWRGKRRKANPMATATMAMLPALGLDGVQALVAASF